MKTENRIMNGTKKKKEKKKTKIKKNERKNA